MEGNKKDIYLGRGRTTGRGKAVGWKGICKRGRKKYGEEIRVGNKRETEKESIGK